MQSQDSVIQMTFHYTDGQSESFYIYDPPNIHDTAQELRQEVRHFLDKNWWILHLQEETVYINTAHVLKVEVKPAIPELQGEGVFSNAERITALTRR
ncbi:MAG: hypothetical protein KME06_07060 [Kastovskya adunca ATA6-11-RM4]|jgi:hypothetical protein|nr:hypothetical protein [Kastovskya adunca ATA6-11-RM4]